MSEVVALFAGTTEGRRLAEYFAGGGFRLVVSVATAYGASLLPEAENIEIHVGRMDAGQMEVFLGEKKASVCVDATHPYAVEASENLRLACHRAGVLYLRVARKNAACGQGPSVTFVDSVREAADWLSRTTEGNILITTGSKELAKYTVIPEYRERCFARVLPTAEALESCRDSGLEGSRVIAAQGPFSEELNYGMMKQWEIRYLVTKQSGTQGGYVEKCEAALRAGAHIVTVGRPVEEREGRSLDEVISLLSRRFPQEASRMSPLGVAERENPQGPSKMSPLGATEKEIPQDSPKMSPLGAVEEESPREPSRVSLIGMGPGDSSLCTVQALEALKRCDVIVGAARMLDICRNLGGAVAQKPMYECYQGKKIAAFLKEHRAYQNPAVVFSGDVGLYSGASGVRKSLEEAGFSVAELPGISSTVYFLDRLGIPWEEVRIASCHGQSCDVAKLLRDSEKVCVLLGREDDVSRICGTLAEPPVGGVRVTVGERLSYPGERIVTGSAEEMRGRNFDPLSVALFEREENCRQDSPKGGGRETVTPGWPDRSFVRGEVPMTREEIRAVSLAKLGLDRDSVLYDIGAGTGSVSAEAAALCTSGRVYAVERRSQGVELIRANRERFRLENLKIVEGEAPEALAPLEPPTHVFIGGSGGRLLAIVRSVRAKNRAARFVVNAVTLETLSGIAELMEEYPEYEDMEIVQVSVARGKRRGNYHLMTGENPVYIISFGGESEELRQNFICCPE